MTDEYPTLNDELGTVEAIRDRLAERFGADEVSIDAHDDGAGITLRYHPIGGSPFAEATEWATDVATEIDEQTSLDVSMGVDTRSYDSDTGEVVHEPEARVTGRTE